MIRKIIKIDEEKCNGCGLCAKACHEGAIGMINGKAKLLRDDYCDGLGDCLPVCPTDAISFIEREAAAYDEEAVKANMEKKKSEPLPCGCSGTHAKGDEEAVKANIEKKESEPLPCGCSGTHAKSIVRDTHCQTAAPRAEVTSQLCQWPVQIKLVPTKAPYLDRAHLLVAADCSAYAYGNFHSEFMKNKITIIGCPKLDDGNYADKLTEILRLNDIKSVTVVRMEVPCCGGIEYAVKSALQNSGKMIPWRVVTISTSGEILED